MMFRNSSFIFLMVVGAPLVGAIDILESDFAREQEKPKVVSDSASSFVQKARSLSLGAVADEEILWETVSPNCRASQWSVWSPCSSTCGPEGYRTRTRHVEPSGCVTDMEREVCKPKACPVDCVFAEWGPFGECSQECYGGKKTRTRGYKVLASVANETHLAGAACCGKETEQEPCGAPKEDCVMSQWAEWTSCSRTCNTGTTRRTRHIEQFPKCGGHSCICSLLEVKNCEEKECKNDCELSKWTEWTACPEQCGGATQTRKRNVTRIPSAGGADCEHLVESKNCAMRHCKTDCVLNPWADWTSCSATCHGVTKRARTVQVQAAGYGKEHQGIACDDLQETKPCNENCRLDCETGEWAEWSACSKTCGGGSSHRTRPVIQQIANGGAACGDLAEVRNCSCVECSHSDSPSSGPVFPSADSEEFGQLKKYCGEMGDLETLFKKHGNLEATIEWCLENAGPEGFPLDGSPHLQDLMEVCETHDLMLLKELYSDTGGLEGAMDACQDAGGLPKGYHHYQDAEGEGGDNNLNNLNDFSDESEAPDASGAAEAAPSANAPAANAPAANSPAANAPAANAPSANAPQEDASEAPEVTSPEGAGAPSPASLSERKASHQKRRATPQGRKHHV